MPSLFTGYINKLTNCMDKWIFWINKKLVKATIFIYNVILEKPTYYKDG